jgi:peptide chain release factor 1
MWDKLQDIETRYEELAQEMARPEVAADFQRLQALAKEHASLEGIVSLYREYKRVDTALAEARSLAEESADPEMAAMARDEAAHLSDQRDQLEEQVRLALLPKDPYDERPVIMEVRAAAGGEEAALFAGDLFRMYSRYAERHGVAAAPTLASSTRAGPIACSAFPSPRPAVASTPPPPL